MIKRSHKIIITIVLTICSGVMILAAVCYHFINTASGTETLIKYAVIQSAPYGAVKVGSFTGTIASGLSLKDVELRNWPLLGPGAVVLLQRVDLVFPLFDWHNIQAHIFNGRITLLECDALVFNGDFARGEFHGYSYGRALDVSVIMKPFLPVLYWKNLQGTISTVDLGLEGKMDTPRIKGHFYVDRIEYAGTAVREGLARFDLAFTKPQDQWKTNGWVSLEGGLVNVHRNTIELQKSKANFKGNLLDPELHIYGTAKAGEYAIDLKISGTLVKPVVKAYAEPFLSEDMALMALGLGNWMPSYFSSPIDSGNQRMGVKKKISNDFGVGFALEQSPTLNGEPVEYSKMLEGELSLNEQLSLNVAEIIGPGKDSQNSSSSQNERHDQGSSLLYLKYKNTF